MHILTNTFHYYFVHSFTILSIHQGNFAAKYHLKLLKLFSGRYPTKKNKTVQNVVCKSSTRG